MDSRNKHILYVAGSQIFARRDMNLLSSHYDISMIALPSMSIRKCIDFLSFIRGTIVHVYKADVVIGMLGGAHNWLPFVMSSVFRKKYFIVLGGADSVAIPSIKYGMFFRKNLSTKINLWVYRNVDRLLPVDESLCSAKNYYASETKEPLEIGILKYAPSVKKKIMLLPTEYNQDFWSMNEGKRKPKTVVSVAFVDEEKTFKLKGFDFVLEVARKMPDTSFTIVGISNTYLSKVDSQKPSNVALIEPKEEEDLKEIFNHNSTFFIPSLSEGLPNVLCEAMLCGCIPVGSNVGGIKNAIGDTGFVLHGKDADTAVKVILESFQLEEENRIACRERIIKLFPRGSRKSTLIKTIEDTL